MRHRCVLILHPRGYAVICQACYSTLDYVFGLAEVEGSPYNLAGSSRRDEASTIDEDGYQKFRRRKAAKLGIDLGDAG